MENRIIEFVTILREAKIKNTTAEHLDCIRALSMIPLLNKEMFYYTLRALLVKSHIHYETYDRLFHEFFFPQKREIDRGLQNQGFKIPINENLNPSDQMEDSLGEDSNSRNKKDHMKTEDKLHPKYLSELKRLKLSNKSLEYLLKKILRGSRTDLRNLAHTIARNQINTDKNNKNPQKFNKNGKKHKKRGAKSPVLSLDDMKQIDWSKINYELCKFLYETGHKLPNPEIITRITTHAIHNLEFFKRSLFSFLRMNLMHNLHTNHSQSIKQLVAPESIFTTNFELLDLYHLNKYQYWIEKLAQKLVTRLSLRYHHVVKGRLNIKQTIRYSLKYGGHPFKLKYKKRRISKPEIIALCDVSGSVKYAVKFFLTFLSYLQSLFTRIRTFLFVSKLAEFEITRSQFTPQTIENLFYSVNIDHFGYSNFGKAFSIFDSTYSHLLTRRTTLIILGDARNNYHPSRVDLLEKWQQVVSQIIWLNPEYKHKWNTGDSIISIYAPHCNIVTQCSNLHQLSKIVEQIF